MPRIIRLIELSQKGWVSWYMCSLAVVRPDPLTTSGVSFELPEFHQAERNGRFPQNTSQRSIPTKAVGGKFVWHNHPLPYFSGMGSTKCNCTSLHTSAKAVWVKFIVCGRKESMTSWLMLSLCHLFITRGSWKGVEMKDVRVFVFFSFWGPQVGGGTPGVTEVSGHLGFIRGMLSQSRQTTRGHVCAFPYHIHPFSCFSQNKITPNMASQCVHKKIVVI